MKRLIIAIDGTAASGKSTTARHVAERLGYLHLDTGSMYRAAAYAVLNNNIDPDDVQGVENIVTNSTIRLRKNNGLEVFLDDVPVTDKIRTPEVTAVVSKISAYKGVRSRLVEEQRAIGRNGGVVLEGRDIGTVVFPDAELKFFFIADVEKRAERRWKELKQDGIESDYVEILHDIKRRDHFDTTRKASPLKKADDAILIDTSDMTIEEQVETVLSLVHEKMKKGVAG